MASPDLSLPRPFANAAALDRLAAHVFELPADPTPQQRAAVSQMAADSRRTSPR